MHAVAELLGHSSPALVMARYGHAYAAEKAASAMALERFCAGPPELTDRAGWGPILVQSWAKNGVRRRLRDFPVSAGGGIKKPRLCGAFVVNRLSSAYGI